MEMNYFILPDMKSVKAGMGNRGPGWGSDSNAGNQGGNAGNQGGNEGNKGETLRKRVELTNYNYGERQN